MLHVTEQNFYRQLHDAPLPVVVMFYASWCGKCAMMKPIAEEMARRFREKACFFEVDIDESPKLTDEYTGEFVPAFVFFRDGKCLGSMSGVIGEEQFEERLQKIFRNS